MCRVASRKCMYGSGMPQNTSVHLYCCYVSVAVELELGLGQFVVECRNLGAALHGRWCSPHWGSPDEYLPHRKWALLWLIGYFLTKFLLLSESTCHQPQVHVPKPLVGFVIGRNGEHINNIQNTCGVRLQFQNGECVYTSVLFIIVTWMVWNA